MRTYRFTEKNLNNPGIRLCRFRIRINLFFLIGMTTCLCIEAQVGQEALFPEINISLPERTYKNIRKTRGKKIRIQNALFEVDGKTFPLSKLQLHGKTTLHFERKSFSVELEMPVVLRSHQNKVPLKDFNLLSLTMDKNLWHNRWSFLVMEQLGIFPLINSYCTLAINGQPQGIYLLVEKPQHAMISLNSPYMARRGVNGSIEKDYTTANPTASETLYRKRLLSLYQSGKLHGPALYTHLGGVMDMQKYFTWIAFNYWVMNGDYSDELFMYIQPNTNLFEPIAWDYDDIFKAAPHEGKALRSRILKDRLVYSVEDALDRVIASDHLVYRKYLETVKDMLQLADSALVTGLANKVGAELQDLNGRIDGAYPAYLDQRPFAIDEALADLKSSMKFLHNRRLYLMQHINQDN